MALSRFSKWLVFAAVSVAFCFLNLATFTSLGVVLFTMAGELHWSMTEAFFSFSLLGIACGLSSPLPELSLRRFGGRVTLGAGAALLVAGFALAASAHGIPVFYLAMILLGVGFSLAGNVTGVSLIAAWFERASSRTIGYYLMLGAVGGAFGPPIVEAIVSARGWRGHWELMSGVAVAVGALCLIWVKDRPAPVAVEQEEANDQTDWTPRQAMLTPQFMLVAAAMAITMFCITTNSSVGFSHLVKLGASPVFAAQILSVIAIVATLVKGISGKICEMISSTTVLALGLAVQAAGNLVLAFASTPTLQYVAATVYGVGWGLSYVAGTVVLLDYFGRGTGARILSVVWLITTVAAAGPADLPDLCRRLGGAGGADLADAPARRQRPAVSGHRLTVSSALPPSSATAP
jgi:MFS family permease